MNVVFVSGNRAWGGSEELWSATAAVLASDGHRVTVFKSGVDDSEPRMRRLRTLNCRIHDLARFPLMPRRLFTVVRLLSSNAAYGHETLRLLIGLTISRLTLSGRPDLVVVSQGGNHDGFFLARCAAASVCRTRSFPRRPASCTGRAIGSSTPSPPSTAPRVPASSSRSTIAG